MYELLRRLRSVWSCRSWVWGTLVVCFAGPSPAYAMKGDGQLENPSHVEIANGSEGLASDALDDGDGFGAGIVFLGDISTPLDGIPEIAVGAPDDENDAGCEAMPSATSACDAGAVYILSLNSTTPYTTFFSKIDSTTLEAAGATALTGASNFGRSLSRLDDLDGNGVPELVVGDDGDELVYILFLSPGGAISSLVTIAPADVGLGTGIAYGTAVAGLGDLDSSDSNDVGALAIGGPNNNVTLNNDGTVAVARLTSAGAIVGTPALINGPAGQQDGFGQALDSMGLFDGNAIPDLLVGAFRGGFATVVSLTSTGARDSDIGDIDPSSPTVGNRLGIAATNLGDIDCDSIPDVALGAFLDDNILSNSGSLSVFLLTASAGIDNQVLIAQDSELVGAPLTAEERFGFSAELLPDLDGNGVPEIAVGTQRGETTGSDTGSVYILFLDEINTAPLADAGGPYFAVCSASDQAIAVDASSSSDADGDGLSYFWTTTCPSPSVGSSFDDDAAASTNLNVGTTGATSIQCMVTVTVTDDCGDVHMDSAVVDITNNPPSGCSAGSNYEITCGGLTSSRELLGTTGTDADGGHTLTRLWTTDCDGGSFDDATIETPTLTVDSDTAACTVTLTVTDDCGATCSDTVDVSVTNSIPLCSVSLSDTTIQCSGGTAMVNATSIVEDENEANLEYAWSVECDSEPTEPTIEEGEGDGTADITVDTSMVGEGSLSCTVTLMVTDECGEPNAEPCTADFTVTSSDLMCSFGEPLMDMCDGSETVFDLDAGASSNASISYLWETDCAGASIGDSTAAMTTLTLPSGEADCSVSVTVSDTCGASTQCSVEVTVTNTDPVADAGGPYSFDCTGNDVGTSLDGTASSDDSSVVGYSWSTDCPNPTWIPNNAVAEPGLLVDTSGGPGTCSVFLTVEDDCGAFSTEAMATVDYTNPFTGAVTCAVAPIAPVDCSTSAAVSATSSSFSGFGAPITHSWSTNCPGASFSDNTASTFDFTFDATQTTQCDVSLTVTDVCGATDSCSVSVDVSNTPPSCSILGDFNLVCDAATGSVSLSADVTDTGPVTYLWATDCPGSTMFLPSNTDAAPTLSGIDLAALGAGSCNVNLAVTDECGAEGNCMEALTVNNTPPLIDVNGLDGPTLGTTGLDVTCLPAVLDASGSIDPEGGVLSYLWEAAGPCSFSGATDQASALLTGTVAACLVSLTITDPCGMTDMVTFSLNLTNQAPTCDAGGPYEVASQGATTAVPLDGTASMDPDGTPSYLWDIGDCPGASFDDATLAEPTITVDTSTSPVECTVSLTVTDDCGVSADPCMATIGISEQNPICDAGGPYLGECAGADTMIQLDGSASAPPGDGGGGGGGGPPPISLSYAWTTDCPSGTFDDDTSATPILTLDGSPMGTSCSVELTVMTDGGGSAMCSVGVTVSDTALPDLTCPLDLERGTNDGCTWVPGEAIDGGLVVSDNCTPEDDIVVTNDAPSVFPLGMTTVMWTATDAAGNMATCEQIITVVDDTPPTVSCPPDKLRPAEGGCVSSPADGGGASRLGTGLIVGDNCSDAMDIKVTNDAPADLGLGTHIVTWTVEDEAGNQTTCQQMVTVEDEDPPMLTCPSNVVRSTNDGCTLVPVAGGGPESIDEGLAVSDNCTAEGDIVVTNNAPAALPLGETIVEWTATDSHGNSTSCMQTVLVVDGTSPVIVCPANLSRGTNDGDTWVPGSGELGTPTVSDDCTDTGNISVSNDAPSAFSTGVTIVTWTATDMAGNEGSCVQQVTVVDSTAPEITCPQDLNVAPNVDNCSWVGDFGEATVDDPVGVTIVNDAPGSFPEGETIVTWTATDSFNNSSSCEQIVTVVDDVLPTITCPSDITTICADGLGSIVEFSLPAASDNCPGDVAVVCTPPSGSLFPPGVTEVLCTATDGSGNEASCVFSVTVECGGLNVPGDCNGDAEVDISDAVCVINFLFLGIVPRLPCGDGSSTDPGNQALISWLDVGDIDLSDIIALLNWKFLGGAPHHLGTTCRPIPGCPSSCGS